jgi:hypothetical protein
MLVFLHEPPVHLLVEVKEEQDVPDGLTVPAATSCLGLPFTTCSTAV